MNVQESPRRAGQQLSAQNLPVGDDHSNLGLESAEFAEESGVIEPLGLEDPESSVQGPRLHGRGTRTMTPAARPIGPRHDRDDVVAGSEQGIERRNREFRSA